MILSNLFYFNTYPINILLNPLNSLLRDGLIHFGRMKFDDCFFLFCCHQCTYLPLLSPSFASSLPARPRPQMPHHVCLSKQSWEYFHPSLQCTGKSPKASAGANSTPGKSSPLLRNTAWATAFCNDTASIDHQRFWKPSAAPIGNQ